MANILETRMAPAIVASGVLMRIYTPLIRVRIPYQIPGSILIPWVGEGKVWFPAPPAFGVHTIEARSQFDLDRKIASFRDTYYFSKPMLTSWELG